MTLSTSDVLLAVEPEDVTAGGIGFVVIAALAVGTAVLLRSLNKQLKKVDFDEEPEPGRDAEKPAEKLADSGSEPAAEEPAGDEPEEGPKSPTS
ncbi:MAG: hypothetical protein ACRDPQ_04040 [Nocardioidaceae bacterium]